MNRAHTYYTDLEGTAAADVNPPTGFRNLAQSAGIDTERYEPVGVKLGGTPPKITAIYAIDVQNIVPMAAGAIQAFVQERPDEVRLKKFELREAVEMESHLKQFEAIVTVMGLDLSEVEESA